MNNRADINRYNLHLGGPSGSVGCGGRAVVPLSGDDGLARLGPAQGTTRQAAVGWDVCRACRARLNRQLILRRQGGWMTRVRSAGVPFV